MSTSQLFIFSEKWRPQIQISFYKAATQKLGDTLLLWDGGKLVGLAVCHCGPGTDAGSGTCYIKFGAVRPGTNAGQDFNNLLSACETMAAEVGLQKILAGVNTGRQEAYR